MRAVEPYRRFEPVRIKEDVSRQEVAVLESHPVRAPRRARRGRAAAELPLRDASAAHVLGYVGQISAAELKSRADLGYRIGRPHRQDGDREGARRGTQGARRLPADGGRLARPGPQGPLEHRADPRARRDAHHRPRRCSRPRRRRSRSRRGRSWSSTRATAASSPRRAAPRIDPNRFSHGLSQEEWDAVYQRRPPPAAEPDQPGAVPAGVGLQDRHRASPRSRRAP